MPPNVAELAQSTVPGTTGSTNNKDISKRVADDLEHPERFWVDYLVEAASDHQARQLARGLCLEQTVELPGSIEAVQQVEPYTVGSVERVQLVKSSRKGPTGTLDNALYRITVGYPNDTAGDELTQFLNVVFGNTSLKKGVAVENVTLSPRLHDNTKLFPGPQFGIAGLRKLLRVPRAPLLCTALKPMGKSSQEFADMAYHFAKGGIDIIKDDHGLADQVWAPFEERVRLCAAAVQRANQETGRTSLYCPCLNAPVDQLLPRAFYSQQVGAGAVMVLPGITGWDILRRLAVDPNFSLPILVHPALLGGWLESEDESDGSKPDQTSLHHPHGMAHKFLFGILPRLCGADAVIFPNAGGRFQFTPQECQQVADGCRRPMGRFKDVLPSPAGGMKLHRVDQMRQTFGDDTLFLIGGALLEQGPDLELDAQAFAHSAGRDRPYAPPRSSQEDDGTTPSTKAVGESAELVPSVAEVERVANCVRRRVLEYTLRVSALFKLLRLAKYLDYALSALTPDTRFSCLIAARSVAEQRRLPFPGLFCGRNTSNSLPSCSESWT